MGELAAADQRVARALLVEVGERVHRFVEEIPLASFITVEERVARHLLDLAVPDEQGVLGARVSHGRLGLPGRAYSVTGVKHFGSGLGIMDWMVTTAVPEGEDEPEMFDQLFETSW